jgi:hypothetical protein
MLLDRLVFDREMANVAVVKEDREMQVYVTTTHYCMLMCVFLLLSVSFHHPAGRETLFFVSYFVGYF